MEYKDLFKSRRMPSLAELLTKRCQSVAAERQEKRREFFWGAVIPTDAEPSNKPEPLDKKKNSRMEMLQKWKAEKMQRLEEAKKKQKPIFKVGVVQRKVTGSPVFSQPRNFAKNNFLSNHSQVSDFKEKKTGVLTRAGAKARNITLKATETQQVSPKIKSEKKFNKFCKIDENKKKQVNSTVFKVPEVVSKLPCSSLTFPYSPKVTKKGKKLVTLKEKKLKKNSLKKNKPSQEDPQKENKIEIHQVQKENKIGSNEVQKENEIENNMVTPQKQDDFRPIHYSPFVTVRSGKKSPRKSKRKLAMDVDEQIQKEEKEFQCRIFSFRKYIDCETRRLAEVCEKWRHIYEEFGEIPGDVEGDIDSAIGKTNLLTSDKFKQFAGLIDKCENGDPFVKVDDLQGFQDWVSIEVERVDDEFVKLEGRKRNGWKPDPAASLPQKNSQTNALKIPPRKKPLGKSNIRSHILAARKLLKEGSASGGVLQLPAPSVEEAPKVKTPRKEQSLLREVLDPETKTKSESSAKKFPVAREKRNSGLEIMVATQKNKFPTPVKKTPVANDYEVFFGEEKTPNRSILKKSCKKSTSSKARVTFQTLGSGGRGLNEKYFRPAAADSEEDSPKRVVLSDVGNIASEGVRTRSKSKLSFEPNLAKSPQYSYF